MDIKVDVNQKKVGGYAKSVYMDETDVNKHRIDSRGK